MNGILRGFAIFMAAPLFCQVAPRALRLAQTGHCVEALPLLKGASAQSSQLKRDFQLAGVRCAMTLNRPADALGFAQVLQRDFGTDPEVLYVLTHIYSDLSMRASQDLLSKAPSSYQVHQLNAEALEVQGKWADAAKEYEAILQAKPDVPGIHFRLGRLLLSKQPQTADQIEKAKAEFEAELKVNPTNPGAEFVLGELARRDDKFDEAIAHFSRAVEYDAGNADAHLGLGRSYMGAKRFQEAISPLETAARLEPANPETHFQLATAYAREGRKADSAREASLHKEMLARDRERQDSISKGVRGLSNQ